MNLGIDAHHLQPYAAVARSRVDRQREMRAQYRDPLARAPAAPTGSALVAAPGEDTDRLPASNSVVVPLDTHWSRFLYHDFLSADAGSTRARSPLVAGAVLLCIYIATSLAFAGVIRALASPDTAATVAPGGPTVPASVAAASDPHVDVGDSRQRGTLG